MAAQKKGEPSRPALHIEWCSLADATNVLSLEPLGTLSDLKLHSITLAQTLEALHLDRSVVHEDVLTVFLSDEPETLRIVEPLH